MKEFTTIHRLVYAVLVYMLHTNSGSWVYIYSFLAFFFSQKTENQSTRSLLESCCRPHQEEEETGCRGRGRGRGRGVGEQRRGQRLALHECMPAPDGRSQGGNVQPVLQSAFVQQRCQ